LNHLGALDELVSVRSRDGFKTNDRLQAFASFRARSAPLLVMMPVDPEDAYYTLAIVHVFG
jgi:hypothetical protein